MRREGRLRVAVTLVAGVIGWIAGASIERLASAALGWDEAPEYAPVPPAVVDPPREGIPWLQVATAICFALLAGLILRRRATDPAGPGRRASRGLGAVLVVAGVLYMAVALFTGQDATAGDSTAYGCRAIGSQVEAIGSHTYGGGADGSEALARCRAHARARLIVGLSEAGVGSALVAASRRGSQRIDPAVLGAGSDAG